MNKQTIDANEEEMKIKYDVALEEYRKLCMELEGFLWRTRSSTEKYESSMRLSESMSVTEYDEIGLKDLNPIVLDAVWKAICSYEPILENQSGSDRETHVYPFINTCLDIILREFGAPYLNQQIQIQLKLQPILSNVSTKPDFVICSHNIMRPAWVDCLGFIECTDGSSSEFKENAGRVMQYGKDALVRASANMEKIVRFSAVTDGRRIQFFSFVCEDGEKDAPFTEIVEFLPKIRSESGECSEGVKLLCQFVQLMAEQAVVFPSSVIIGDKEYPIRSNLERTCAASNVCTIDMDGTACVVKYSKEEGLTNLSLFREFHVYKYLNHHHNNMHILKLHDLSNEQMLIFKQEEGESLKSWSSRLLFPEGGVASLEDKELFLSKMRDVLGEIINLHELGYTHGDICPRNVLILIEGKPCLFDLDCVDRLEIPTHILYRLSIYTAKTFFENFNSKCCLYLKVHDLESFVYSFLDCIAPEFFQRILNAFGYLNEIPQAAEVVISDEFIDYRTEIFHEIINNTEGPTKLTKLMHHNDLLKIFAELYLETSEFRDESNILSIYEKFKCILTFNQSN